ncbi:hypothetical protein COY07_01060 [Candidatus Peregrinibacteria bacterium CG_4_10_14_0_2_um_filter_43_11]|nr:MAG: hypothetical protein COY07_01060 [Candidatus Peregrinibacteria bacterium CG_4_10_14_0_2_um_filter_43_11]
MKKYLILFAFSFIVLTACGDPSGRGSRRDRPFLGNADAPVLIEEFSDFECPACEFISPEVARAVRENPTLARLEFYQFPLPYHTYAFVTAEASECAGEQGKFWEFADLAFENQKNLSIETIHAIGDQLGLDSTSFGECISSHKYKNNITADQAEGQSRGLKGTPTLYLNGQETRFSGYESFVSYLRTLASQSATSK